MRLFEYSDLTAEIPADIFDSIVDIERLHALDGIRSSLYGEEMAVSRGPMLDSAKAAAEILYGAGSDAHSEAIGSLVSDPRDLSFDDPSLRHVCGLIGMADGIYRSDSRRSAIRTEDIPEALAALDESYRMADGADVNPLLLVPAAVVDLINVAPLSERNLEAAMLLMQSLFLSHGFMALACVPLESMIDQEDLEEALDDCSHGWADMSGDQFPFVRIVCEAVLACERRFDACYPLDMGRKLDKSTRILNVIKESRAPLSKTDICSMLPDVSRRTADSVISELLESRMVEKMGSYRDARYTVSRERNYR
jgi:hypothetical protein